MNLREFQLIERIRRKLTKKKNTICGVGDDCAVTKGRRGFYGLLTVDSLVDRVHFDLKTFSSSHVGRKAMGAALSDIAAMGGRPLYALISLGLPPSFSSRWVDGLYRGLLEIARLFDVWLIGGNISRSKIFWISITVCGEVAKEKCKFRSGAGRGDGLFVTGPLGGAALNRYRKVPRPRIKEGLFLGGCPEVKSLIDVSDGLASDLGHILKESGQGALVDYERIPRPAKAGPRLVLSGGEDYELLFTLKKGKEGRFLKRAKKRGFSFYWIGSIVPRSRGLKILDAAGREIRLKSRGYDHFAAG